MATINYAPAGKCIYCGSVDPPLSREHIIPFGLEGSHVIPKASCKPCAAVTGKIENFVLRSTFGSVRASLGLQTRRPKERPSSFPVTLVKRDGAEEEIDVATSNFPACLLFPEFPKARILQGLPPSADKNFGMMPFVAFADKGKDLEILNKNPVDEFSHGESIFHVSLFTRFLAKIGHCYAYANRTQNYCPVARDFIFGDIDDPLYLVGCNSESPFTSEASGLHRLAVTQTRKGRTLVYVQIFCSFNTPVYHVVVGVDPLRRP